MDSATTNRSGDRRGQRHPSPNRCWVGKSSEKTPVLVARFSKLSLRGYGVSRSLSNSARHLMGRYDRARKRKFNFLPRDSRRAAIISQSYTVIAMVVMAAQVKCVRRCSKLTLAHRKLVHSRSFPPLPKSHWMVAQAACMSV
ncbi:uncharacterized protein K444DRAFT_619043 [Hyaloscypha bicolor E]|uniref:Uncharacterized protein n=1 Tax=Hyaloscypha bicolor E TaxID=1095630 RepID=A0A2J6SRW9_9HELO|nr:uncharacterized protein K444DRAFT_619043 [Hyaloscypha bicolor E]PMD53507.1 hypothetical protein K444DRAFT_619043 [Hyaloscypha bicolor E]